MVYTLVFVPTLVSYIEFRFSLSLIRLAAAFQKVLGFISRTAVIAIPEFNKFLVHYEMALYSYPLDLVVRVSQRLSTVKTLEDSVERLAQKDGNVLFFRAGRIAHRTLGKTPSQILKCSRSSSQRSCLRNEDILARHVAYTRINSTGWKHSILSGSQVVVPAFWFCPS